jgi:hypothetical protein
MRDAVRVSDVLDVGCGGLAYLEDALFLADVPGIHQ